MELTPEERKEFLAHMAFIAVNCTNILTGKDEDIARVTAQQICKSVDDIIAPLKVAPGDWAQAIQDSKEIVKKRAAEMNKTQK